MTAQRPKLADAERTALAARRELIASWQPWRETLHAQRTAAVLGAGFAAGFALALLPLRWWSRAGAFAFRAAAHAARLPLPFGARRSRGP